jgi:hypothetical protein
MQQVTDRVARLTHVSMNNLFVYKVSSHCLYGDIFSRSMLKTLPLKTSK